VAITSERKSLDDYSDEQLLIQFRKGTAKAFEVIVDRYTKPLLRCIYRRVGDLEKSRDLLQDTFVKVYRNRYSYDPTKGGTFSAWIRTIATNCARSAYRKQTRRSTFHLSALTDGGKKTEIRKSDEHAAPVRFAERSLIADHIPEALKEIDMSFRAVIVLRDVQNLSYAEIAEITGSPLGTVKSRLNRGRAKLQRMLSFYREDLNTSWPAVIPTRDDPPRCLLRATRHEMNVHDRRYVTDEGLPGLEVQSVWFYGSGRAIDVRGLETLHRKHVRAYYWKTTPETSVKGKEEKKDSSTDPLEDVLSDFKTKESGKRVDEMFKSVS